MNLVGLMLVENDEWVLGFAARAALKWCDSIVVMVSDTQDHSAKVLSDILIEHPGRVVITESQKPKATGSELMNELLQQARENKATHIAVLKPSEVLTSNLLGLKKVISTISPGQIVYLPLMHCWKNHHYYRNDTSTWSRATVPIAFIDALNVSWKGPFQRLPPGPHWTAFNPVMNEGGGILNLENVNWRHATAKQYLSEMVEIVKRPAWKQLGKMQRAHVLDESGIKLTKIPDQWYDGYRDILSFLHLDEPSPYEKKIAYLQAEHGQSKFLEIQAPNEMIAADCKAPPVTVLTPEPKKHGIKIAKGQPQEALPQEIKPSLPKHSIAWSGHFLDYSGYGKANREMLFRAANSLNILLDSSELSREPVLVDERTKLRVNAHSWPGKPAGVPYFRFFGPREEAHKGYKICYTMMETYGTHPDLAALLNRYDEVWVPTEWNKSIFESSGVSSPVRTMPLGIDPVIYKPGSKKDLRPSILLTTSKAGRREVPKGFLFVNTSNPSFRKGIDVVIKSFEDAFADNPDVALVLCVSYSSLIHCDPFTLVPGGQASCRSRIYVLDGKMDEYEMADMYRSCDVYVTASRGEGWNLPLMEASGCGLPVIAPDAFSHKEFLTEENSYLFLPDKLIPIPNAEKISPWYKDQFFVDYEAKSIGHLTELMTTVAKNPAQAIEKGSRLRKDILEKYTWDIVAAKLTTRLFEVGS